MSGYLNGCDFGFTGHVTLESLASGQSELVLTHFRAYDPLLGRWLSADPIGEAGGTNLYAYCYGNPLNLYDPDGMTPVGTEDMRDYERNKSEMFGGGIGAFYDAFGTIADFVFGMMEPPTVNGQVVLTGTVCFGGGSLRWRSSNAAAAQAYKDSLRAASRSRVFQPETCKISRSTLPGGCKRWFWEHCRSRQAGACYRSAGGR